MKITLHISALLKIIGVAIMAGATITHFVADPPTSGMLVGFAVTIIGVVLEPPGMRKW